MESMTKHKVKDMINVYIYLRDVKKKNRTVKDCMRQLIRNS